MGKALVTQVWGPDSVTQTHAKLQSQCLLRGGSRDGRLCRSCSLVSPHDPCKQNAG